MSPAKHRTGPTIASTCSSLATLLQVIRLCVLRPVVLTRREAFGFLAAVVAWPQCQLAELRLPSSSVRFAGRGLPLLFVLKQAPLLLFGLAPIFPPAPS